MLTISPINNITNIHKNMEFQSTPLFAARKASGVSRVVTQEFNFLDREKRPLICEIAYKNDYLNNIFCWLVDEMGERKKLLEVFFAPDGARYTYEYDEVTGALKNDYYHKPTNE